MMRGRAGWSVALAALWLGCLAPTIPLPPPEQPDFFAGSEPGKVRLAAEGGALREAIVTAYNTNTSVPHAGRVCAALADERGSWSCELQASAGDRLHIYQEHRGEISDYLSIVVPPQTQWREP